MLWIWLLCVCACVRAAEFGCRDPRCEQNGDISGGLGSFVVEGHTIFFGYKVDKWQGLKFGGLYINCGGWAALESTALPRFNTTRAVSAVWLKNCPLPAGAALRAKLAPLNVVLEPKDNKFKLYLQDLPAEPRLTADHLSGLEFLTTLVVFAPLSGKTLSPVTGFLSSLSSLRELLLLRVQMHTEELRSLPSLVWLRHAAPTMPALHHALVDIVQTAPNLRVLKLDMTAQADRHYKMKLVDDEIRFDQRYFGEQAVATLELPHWTEKTPSPLQHCESLKIIESKHFDVEELPARWVSACPHLESLQLWGATRLSSLPDNFLEGAAELKTLRLSNTGLTYLPDGLLKDAHKLEKLYITDAKLKTLNSDMFQSARATLTFLELTDHELDNSALAAVAGLDELFSLDLSNNKLEGDVCDEEEFAAVRRLPRLRALYLSANQLQACRFWRSYFRSVSSLVVD